MTTERGKALNIRMDRNPVVKAEPPSPMSHAGILARHAAYRLQNEQPASPLTKLPSLGDGDKTRRKKDVAKPPGRKFSFGKFGFFGRRPGTAEAPQPPPPSPPPMSPYQVTPGRAPGGALMAPKNPSDQRLTLVLDLDETLVRSSFDMTFEFDFEAPFALNGCWCTARVRKRPFVDAFLARVAQHFELVVMTAGVEPYASLVLDILDTNRVLEHRFYRDSCTKTDTGLLVKDLSRMNRDLERTIIVDNSPNAYLWHPENAVDIKDFVGDQTDAELLTVADFLDVIKDAKDVRAHLQHWKRGKAYAHHYDADRRVVTPTN